MVCDHMSSGGVCRTSVFSFVRFSTENPEPLCFVDMVNRLLINHWKWGELNRSVGGQAFVATKHGVPPTQGIQT